MTSTTNLIERLEKAGEGSRNLDEAIYNMRIAEGFVPERGQPGYPAFAYTTSLDAAMTLIPTDGSMNFVEFSWSWEPSEPEVWPAVSVRWYPPHKSGPDWHAFVVSARTPPLTVCIAALRARGVS